MGRVLSCSCGVSCNLYPPDPRSGSSAAGKIPSLQFLTLLWEIHSNPPNPRCPPSTVCLPHRSLSLCFQSTSRFWSSPCRCWLASSSSVSSFAAASAAASVKKSGKICIQTGSLPPSARGGRQNTMGCPPPRPRLIPPSPQACQDSQLIAQTRSALLTHRFMFCIHKSIKLFRNQREDARMERQSNIRKARQKERWDPIWLTMKLRMVHIHSCLSFLYLST